jgi:hypothetical protein
MPSPKPTLVVRRPPPEADRFVFEERLDARQNVAQDGQALRSTPDVALDVQAPGATSDETARSLVARRNGRVRRRMTVYLPPELAQQLAVHCTMKNVEISNVVAEAVAAYFGPR